MDCETWCRTDGIEPLAHRDRVYSPAATPVSPYLRSAETGFICNQSAIRSQRTDFFIDQCRLRENPSVYEGDGAAR